MGPSFFLTVISSPSFALVFQRKIAHARAAPTLRFDDSYLAVEGEERKTVASLSLSPSAWEVSGPLRNYVPFAETFRVIVDVINFSVVMAPTTIPCERFLEANVLSDVKESSLARLR